MDMLNVCVILPTLVLFMSTRCYADELLVNTTYGLVRGYSEYVQGTKVDKFLGIPYASAPLEDLRFADPVPPDTWTDTREATRFPPPCATAQHPQDQRAPRTSEDCLYLNVFIPEVFRDVFDGLPVLVLLGSLPVGYDYSSSNSPAGGATLSESFMVDGSVFAVIEGVIVVTVNYRRDVFGFLATGNSSHAGNYALKDQAMALRWVAENIAQFRGNNRSITLGGFMEGGNYVAMHMVSEESKGLFQKAFMTGSISPYSDAARKHYPEGGPAERFTRELAEKVGCSSGDDEGEDIVSCFRKLSTKNITTECMELYEDKYKNQTNGYWMFTDRVDGVFLPRDVTDLWEEGAFNNVSLMVGGAPVPTFTDFEPVDEVNEAEYMTGIQRLVSTMPWEETSQNDSYFQPLVQAAMFIYNNWTSTEQNNAKQLKMMETDQTQAGQIKTLSVFTDFLKHRNVTSPAAYKYVFNYKSTNSRKPGVQVGDDVLYILGAPLTSHSWSFQDQQVSRIMMAFYGNFIYHGDPTHTSGFSWWPVYNASGGTYLEVNREGGTDIGHHYRQEKVTFWTGLRPQVLAGLGQIVRGVRGYPSKYDVYVGVIPNNSTEENEVTTATLVEESRDENTDDGSKKYFVTMWVLAGISIALATGIVVLLVVTYRARAEAYTFEGTKL